MSNQKFRNLLMLYYLELHIGIHNIEVDMYIFHNNTLLLINMHNVHIKPPQK